MGGDNFWGGTFEIQSERSGFALELAVDFVRMAGRGGGFGGFGGGGRGGARRRPGRCSRCPPAPPPAPAVQPIQGQRLYDVLHGWPAGNIDLRIGDYMMRPHQKWTITPVPNAGGYPGSPYFKIKSPAPIARWPRPKATKW